MKITLNANDFLRDFHSIASAVSKKDSRPILQCVNLTIDFTTSTMTMLATDSEVLTMRTGKLPSEGVENPEGYKKVSFNVPAEDFVKSLKAFIPKKKQYCIIEICYNADKDCNALEIVLGGFPCFKIQINADNYPNVENWFSEMFDQLKNDKDCRSFTLGTQVLKSVIAYAERMGEDAVKFALPATPGQQIRPVPFCISQDLGKTFGIIVPMRAY